MVQCQMCNEVYIVKYKMVGFIKLERHKVEKE